MSLVRGMAFCGVFLALAAACAKSTPGASADPPAVTSTSVPTTGAVAPSASAATPASASGPAELSGTAWRAAGAQAEAGSAASVPTITFDSSEHVSGSTGCNHFSGKVIFAGDSIRIGPLAMTRRGCARSLMEQEKTFVGALDAARLWRRTQGGEVLELRDDDRAIVLRLTRVEASTPAR
jgi:putative lipoprotein